MTLLPHYCPPDFTFPSSFACPIRCPSPIFPPMPSFHFIAICPPLFRLHRLRRLSARYFFIDIFFMPCLHPPFHWPLLLITRCLPLSVIAHALSFSFSIWCHAFILSFQICPYFVISSARPFFSLHLQFAFSEVDCSAVRRVAHAWRSCAACRSAHADLWYYFILIIDIIIAHWYFLYFYSFAHEMFVPSSFIFSLFTFYIPPLVHLLTIPLFAPLIFHWYFHYYCYYDIPSTAWYLICYWCRWCQHISPFRLPSPLLIIFIFVTRDMLIDIIDIIIAFAGARARQQEVTYVPRPSAWRTRRERSATRRREPIAPVYAGSSRRLFYASSFRRLSFFWCPSRYSFPLLRFRVSAAWLLHFAVFQFHLHVDALIPSEMPFLPITSIAPIACLIFRLSLLFRPVLRRYRCWLFIAQLTPFWYSLFHAFSVFAKFLIIYDISLSIDIAFDACFRFAWLPDIPLAMLPVACSLFRLRRLPLLLFACAFLSPIPARSPPSSPVIFISAVADIAVRYFRQPSFILRGDIKFLPLLFETPWPSPSFFLLVFFLHPHCPLFSLFSLSFSFKLRYSAEVAEVVKMPQRDGGSFRRLSHIDVFIFIFFASDFAIGSIPFSSPSREFAHPLATISLMPSLIACRASIPLPIIIRHLPICPRPSFSPYYWYYYWYWYYYYIMMPLFDAMPPPLCYHGLAMPSPMPSPYSFRVVSARPAKSSTPAMMSSFFFHLIFHYFRPSSVYWLLKSAKRVKRV